MFNFQPIFATLQHKHMALAQHLILSQYCVFGGNKNCFGGKQKLYLSYQLLILTNMCYFLA